MKGKIAETYHNRKKGIHYETLQRCPCVPINFCRMSENASVLVKS